MTQEKTAPKTPIPAVDKSPSEKISRRRVVLIPTRDEDGIDWELEGGEIDALQETYPTLDAAAVIKHMVTKLWRKAKADRWTKNRQGVKNGIWAWFAREAEYARKGKSRFKRAGVKEIEPWWRTDDGWLEHGALAGVIPVEGEAPLTFKARVCVAIGEGPWITDFFLWREYDRLRNPHTDPAFVRQCRDKIMSLMGDGGESLH